jgi:sec-independent protein translocase protein TatC
MAVDPQNGPERPAEETPSPEPGGPANHDGGTRVSNADVDPYNYIDPYWTESDPQTSTAVEPAKPAPPPPPPPPPAEEEDAADEEEEGMLRMSFMDHLEELRQRIIRALMGLGVAFVLSLAFANNLWNIIQQPAHAALVAIGAQPKLIITSPMEGFMIIWVKVPLLASIFLASPWVLWQVWAFISPGLYKRERRWAAPFIVSAAGLFVLGGLFAYFVAFRFGLTFLLGIGRDINVEPFIKVTDYFDLFVNVTLGVALVFQLPVLIFFLTLLRIASPGWLLSNSRYAILLIVALAAVVTPTPDIFNLALFSVPMIVLFYIGCFASYALVLHRENKRFPWGRLLLLVAAILLAAAGIVYLMVTKYGFKLVLSWPFLVR